MSNTTALQGHAGLPTNVPMAPPNPLLRLIAWARTLREENELALIDPRLLEDAGIRPRQPDGHNAR